MEYHTLAGNFYTITSRNGSSVTDSTGTLNEAVEAGKQLTVQAPSDKLIIDDEQAIVFKAPFKYALAALGLLGGGKDKLPAGYMQVDFLETNGQQWLQVDDLHLGSTSDVNIKFAPTSMASWFSLFSCMSSIRNNRVDSTQVSRKIRYGFINEDYVYSPSELTIGSIYNVRKCGERNFLNGIEQASNKASNFTINAPTLIGKEAYSSTLSHMRIFWFNAAANINVNAIPAIDPTGTPCMFDLVSKTPYYDAGSSGVPFVVGLMLKQAAQLGRKLPRGGGELTVSLPEGYDMNERVVESLLAAEEKGWVLTIQTYTPEASPAASTFGLRRLWVRRRENDNGSYVASNGIRWKVDWCVDVIGADPEMLGYERFRSVEAATAYWELEPYIAPNSEEELLTIEA